MTPYVQACVLVLLWNGLASAQFFPSQNVSLLSRMPMSTLGGGTGSDLWGWTDPLTGNDYALMGRSNGTAFVDVTDGANPIYLGNLPTATGSTFWRDIKVYDNHAYIVSDFNGPHGMQVFDLTQLRDVSSPQTFSAPVSSRGLRGAHNLAINEDTGYGYVLGSNLAFGGLHIVDLDSNPTNPTVAGSFTADGYTHDAQVVTYSGPDRTYAGREIVFAANEDTITIVDVTNKNNPSLLSRRGYPQAAYTHQGWLTEDQQYFLFGDEADEASFGVRTRTHVMDVSDLDNPVYVGFHQHSGFAIDHNLYIKGNYVLQANYTRGLRVLELTDLANADLTEVGFLDTYPNSNQASDDGAWSVYPYFDNGKVIVSDQTYGLFVVEVDALVDMVDADFNDDGQFDCSDIDALHAAILDGDNRDEFDLTGDGVVNADDQRQWLADAGNANLGGSYLAGDANLDGFVDGSDFNVWNARKFTADHAWCRGDFNADGAIDGSDFNEWNANKFTQTTPFAVPEPSSILAMLTTFVASVPCFRRRRSNFAG